MDVKGMRLSACPVTDRRRTRSRRPGQRRRLIHLSGHRLPAHAFP